MEELQAGIEQPLALLPQPPVLLQPRKAALHHSALGHHLERMPLTALGNLHGVLWSPQWRVAIPDFLPRCGA